MTNIKTILLQYDAEKNQGLNELAGRGTAIDQAEAAISVYIKAHVIGEDHLCIKNHPEYYDWCSYCSVEQTKAELRAEMRRKAGL